MLDRVEHHAVRADEHEVAVAAHDLGDQVRLVRARSRAGSRRAGPPSAVVRLLVLVVRLVGRPARAGRASAAGSTLVKPKSSTRSNCGCSIVCKIAPRTYLRSKQQRGADAGIACRRRAQQMRPRVFGVRGENQPPPLPAAVNLQARWPAGPARAPAARGPAVSPASISSRDGGDGERVKEHRARASGQHFLQYSAGTRRRARTARDCGPRCTRAPRRLRPRAFFANCAHREATGCVGHSARPLQDDGMSETATEIPAAPGRRRCSRSDDAEAPEMRDVCPAAPPPLLVVISGRPASAKM